MAGELERQAEEVLHRKGRLSKREIRFYIIYYPMPVRMANIKKTRENKCWRGCGEKETLVHCGWDCKLVQPLWKTAWRISKN